MNEMTAQRRTFYNDLIAQEEAALTYLAAQQTRLSAQERYVSATSTAGSTSQSSITTQAPVSSGGSLPAVFSCIIQAESGGNPTAMNPSGAAGLYQFMPGTWDGYDGYASAADAPPSVQTAKAEQVYAADGLSPWTGDPCVG